MAKFTIVSVEPDNAVEGRFVVGALGAQGRMVYARVEAVVFDGTDPAAAQAEVSAGLQETLNGESAAEERGRVFEGRIARARSALLDQSIDLVVGD